MPDGSLRAGRPVGGLVGWLVGWLADVLTGWMVGWVGTGCAGPCSAGLGWVGLCSAGWLVGLGQADAKQRSSGWGPKWDVCVYTHD